MINVMVTIATCDVEPVERFNVVVNWSGKETPQQLFSRALYKAEATEIIPLGEYDFSLENINFKPVQIQ